jgi:hypothetical protein
MTRNEWLATDPIAFAMAGCALVLVLALGPAACGGKVSSVEIPSEDDAATEAATAVGCGPLDPALTCGTDTCGNAVLPLCRAALWLCPLIASECAADAAAGDGSADPAGFACGAGSCPPGTFCQDPVGTDPGACIPFPLECKRTPNTPSATCACLERRAAEDKICRPDHLLCPYPTANVNALHIGCVAD